jgi:hypothetical protein
LICGFADVQVLGKKRLGTFCRLFEVQLLFFVVLLGAPQGQAFYYTLLIMEVSFLDTAMTKQLGNKAV